MALDLEVDRQRADAETAPVEAPPQPVTTDTTQFSAEGPVPAVSTDEQIAQATASQQAFDASYNLDGGCHHWDTYKSACDLGDPGKWKPGYERGFSTAAGFDGPDNHGLAMQWNVKAGASASQAVKDFLQGLTIADAYSIEMARDIDNLRDGLGDQKFDRLFGSADQTTDAAIPAAQRLTISSDLFWTPFEERMWEVIDAADAKDQQAAIQPEQAPVEQLEEEKEQAKPETATIVADEFALHEREHVG